MSETRKAELLARFDEEIGKAIKSCEEGRVFDAETAFALLEAEIRKAQPKRAA